MGAEKVALFISKGNIARIHNIAMRQKKLLLNDVIANVLSQSTGGKTE
jgi:hypothetical protein